MLATQGTNTPVQPQSEHLALHADAVLDNVTGLPCLRLIGALARAAGQRSTAFDAASVAAALWALTVARHLPHELLDKWATVGRCLWF